MRFHSMFEASNASRTANCENIQGVWGYKFKFIIINLINFTISGYEPKDDSCKPCAIGYYGTGVLAACTQCATGKTTLYIGSDDVTACILGTDVSNQTDLDILD